MESIILQFGTAGSLMAGNYDAEFLGSDVAAGQELGIGSFDKIDGEMLMLDGILYRLPADGKARVAESDAKLPFAVVSKLTNPETFDFPAGDMKAFGQFVDEKMPLDHFPATIKATGEFKMMHFRSVPKQENWPYPPLAEVAKTQPEWTLHNVKGTIVGYRFPETFRGVNIPGYHLHFITEDKSIGGHILAFEADAPVTVWAQYADNIAVKLPKDPKGLALHQK